ncbi:hypothetical protein EVAR_76869_1 [Eumeta japonica]|uniref:Uncharacterized protein n=1 Tax=Eumeta variegata TaxID=151549 RepID=A0A4C1SHG5_EUMVA|nr:hypothetical protein EVAR_76869_1 [Eumeta japonica]
MCSESEVTGADDRLGKEIRDGGQATLLTASNIEHLESSTTRSIRSFAYLCACSIAYTIKVYSIPFLPLIPVVVPLVVSLALIYRHEGLVNRAVNVPSLKYSGEGAPRAARDCCSGGLWRNRVAADLECLVENDLFGRRRPRRRVPAARRPAPPCLVGRSWSVSPP